MKTTNLRRIKSECAQLKTLSDDYKKMFSISMVGDNVFNWKAIIYGPVDSLYVGYEFEVDIKLPDNYPLSPIDVKFVTPIQHVNINSTGDICLDILKDKWIPALNITSVLISIISLLNDPNPEDPLNSELATLYKTNKKKYCEAIKNSCEKYAKKH